MSNIIDSLCMTWRHDYGLHKPDDDDSISSGMTTTEREILRRKMAQIHAHHIAPLEERIRELERASQPGSGEAGTARLRGLLVECRENFDRLGQDGIRQRLTAEIDAIDAARASLDGRS